MNRILFFLLIWSVVGIKVNAQNASYDEQSKKAYAFYEMGEYKHSAELYTRIFSQFDKIKTWDYYNAACSWALCREVDSSFTYLSLAAKQGFYLLAHIQGDKDLSVLHTDNRWEKVLKVIRANKEKADAKLDQELVRVLDTVYNTDQGPRLQLDSLSKKFGWDAEEVQNHWKLIRWNDSVNELKVTRILDEKGWLGSDIIGQQGNITLFLVIQHADLAVQKKYLPMLREAVQKGKAHPSNLALLEDRVALRSGKHQIYGSQIGQHPETGEYEVQPMIEPRKVNERRADVGLNSIEEYISNWNIKWNVDSYLKQLPELRKRYKIKD